MSERRGDGTSRACETLVAAWLASLHLVILAMFCTHMVHNLAKITKFWDGRTDPGRFAKPY